MDYDIPKTNEDIRAKIREEFSKHKEVRDIRTIDMLVIKVNELYILRIIKDLYKSF